MTARFHCLTLLAAAALGCSGLAHAKDSWRVVFENTDMTVEVNDDSISYREDAESVFGIGEVRTRPASGTSSMRDGSRAEEVWMRVEVDCGGTLRYRALEIGRTVHGKQERKAVSDKSWHPYTTETPQESFGYAICEPGEGAG